MDQLFSSMGTLSRLMRLFSTAAQWLRDISFTPSFLRGVAFVVFLLIGMMTETLLHFHAKDSQTERRAAALTYANQLRARVDRELNAVMFLSSGLTSYLVVRHDRIDPGEMRDILASLHSNSRHVRNFSIATGYTVSYVYPLAGNEKILGVDYRTLPEQWPAVRLAIEKARGTLTGPVSLVQGGMAFIYRSPIYVKDHYWGILSTVIDSRSFFDSAFRELDTEHYQFAIRQGKNENQSDSPIWGEPRLFSDPQAVQLEAEVPNGKWLFAVKVQGTAGQSIRIWIARLMGWLFALLSSFGVASLLRQRSELAHQAGFDSLTGLPNRRLFNDRLEQAIRRQARAPSHQLGVLFLDLNGFKEINDHHGHKIGDLALRTTALRIRDQIRICDTVSRWGGDEFVAIIEEADNELMQQLATRLQQHVRQPFEADGRTFQMTASIGTALYPAEAATAGALLELADRRMYENKAKPANRNAT